MAKIYNLCKVKSLKQMNIFYKSILNVFEYEEQFAILLDDNHICFLPNEEEVHKFIKNINLNNSFNTFSIIDCFLIFFAFFSEMYDKPVFGIVSVVRVLFLLVYVLLKK